MKIPISWVKDFITISLPLDDLAHRLTMAGLEVEEIHYVGLPMPERGPEGRQETKITGISWAADKIVVGAILEVMPHPNADRLVLCRLDDGTGEQIVLTGASNLYSYKGRGALDRPIKVAYAREGAQIYDGHQPGQVLATLKRARIRGVDSYSMACSEKELGISDEHGGIIFLDENAPVGLPLVDYMGDAVFDIAIMPNIARDANILGVAREIAALTGEPLRMPNLGGRMDGPPVANRVGLRIEEPELNPRFVLGLVENVIIQPSPYEIQRRLRLAGMRPINNVVDATNYAMLELGQPLHAFDYDVLVQRAGGRAPTLITRRAAQGERLTTLDGAEHTLDDFTVLVCDTGGALSIAGVMGGSESEVSESTRNVLLEGAAWNFINIRRTLSAQHMSSEAAYRFSRGVHPAMAERGVRRGLELMRQWGAGLVSQGLVDDYPLPPKDPTVEITPADVRRWLGIRLDLEEVAGILRRLEFEVEVDSGRQDGGCLRATAPDHRLDINTGVTGVADIMEEVARIYGYERIPETRLADALPPQRGDPALETEERLRDLLAGLGLQEVITYRMTAPEREARLLPPGAAVNERQYARLENPISSDKVVMRHSQLNSVLEVMERNARLRPRLALFEIGPVYLLEKEGELPLEESRLVIALSGPRHPAAWQGSDTGSMDFYDLKGVLEALFDGLHLEGARFEPGEHPGFHPGKCASIYLDERILGVMGELHPLVKERYELPEAPVLAADLDTQLLVEAVPESYTVRAVPPYPPVLEDLAVVVDEDLPAERVAQVIRQAGGKTVIDLRLFDVYRGEQVGAGLKSLAYSLTYQDPERTLTDAEVARVRERIIQRLELELEARIRS